MVLVVVVAVALGGANVAVFALASRGLEQRVDEQLERMGGFAQGLAAAVESGRPVPPAGTPDPSEVPDGRVDAEYVGVVAADGRRVVSVYLGPEDADREPPVVPAGLSLEAGEPAVFDTTAVIDGRRQPYRMWARADDEGAIALAAVPSRDLANDRRSLARLQVVAALTVLVVLALLARWLVAVGLRPLARMEQAAERIADGDLTQRVEPAGPGSEISRFGTTLNRMLAAIEQAFAAKEHTERRLRRFVADASHELRTPLTSIRGYAQLLRRDRIADSGERTNAARRIESEATRLAALVDDLLVLARLDEHTPPRAATLDVSRLVGRVVDDARVVDPYRVISYDVPGPVELTGDEDGLTRVLTNLLANARQHTPPGSPVEVVVRPDASSGNGTGVDGAGVDGADTVVIDVVDHGDGIDPHERPHLFTRFHRADPSRSRGRGGAGLGLAIVAGIVSAHSGRAEVLDTPGGGATFRVVLPRRNPTPVP